MSAARAPTAPVLPVGLDALGRLMPMSLWVGPRGIIHGAGPTLAKLFAGQTLIGAEFFDLFVMLRPRNVGDPSALVQCGGQRLKLRLRQPPHTGLRGQCVALTGGQGVLLNMSFGIAVADAVRDHRLTDSDFTPTDLAVEMLYLIEAKSAAMEELRRLNLRLQEARAAAENQALTDALTGLRNRRAMDLALEDAAQRHIAFGLLHVDLDRFKQVNDTLGHAAGDHVLAHVARILREETRADDTVARVGGDEFVLILPGLTSGRALNRIAERIIRQIEAPVRFDGQLCRVSASIGMTSSVHYPAPRPDRLLSDADRALYVSKNRGRGRYTLFTPSLKGDPACHCRAEPGTAQGQGAPGARA
ncbi:diguanylate cyclase domain-containing protein [Alkalilacustris brevis]|uniref:diguanylate cyclase domain-containing protein n=1 Tax=Alkalilacustris brevis TaxID=2026338 RepID=UPI000E0D6B92|nr:diguanylate cyclase [Alkalilacustris brevis]